ncbi:hypothetical protein Q5Z23_35365, partial [Pseudomonas aeruginosa]|uniref:hypothetical protein n=1 Tax=Pseudomonas aeruginosa TaxID=287 RepID=UPI00271427B3
TQLAGGAEARSWRSVASGNTQLAGGAEARSWRSVASGNTQLALGAEARSWRSDSGRNTKNTTPDRDFLMAHHPARMARSIRAWDE